MMACQYKSNLTQKLANLQGGSEDGAANSMAYPAL